MTPILSGVVESTPIWSWSVKRKKKRLCLPIFQLCVRINLALASVTRVGDFCTLGNFLKPVATINLPKSPTLLGNFCKGAKIIHFSNEIIFGQLLWTFGNFYLVTLVTAPIASNWHRTNLFHLNLELHIPLKCMRVHLSEKWSNIKHRNVFCNLKQNTRSS